MQKVYTQPQVEVFQFASENVIAGSPIRFDDTAGDEQLSHKKRNMWGNEENEEQGGVW